MNGLEITVITGLYAHNVHLLFMLTALQITNQIEMQRAWKTVHKLLNVTDAMKLIEL